MNQAVILVKRIADTFANIVKRIEELNPLTAYHVNLKAEAS